jgi:hypothetical protein
LILVGNHALGALGDVDVDVCIGEGVPLKQSFFQLLSAMMGRSWFGLDKRRGYYMLNVKTPSLLWEEIMLI